MAERFAKLDTDGSGGVSAEEMAAKREARGERAGKGKRGMRGGHGMRGGGMMMRMADTNGDGSITRAEFDAALEARFAKMDANGDGVVTQDERKAARDAMRAEWKAKREARQNQ